MPDSHLTEPTGDQQCLHEFVETARARLNDNIWDYLVGGTETETTLRRNRLALDSIAFRPRVLRDVSSVSCAGRFLGRESAHPCHARTGGLARILPPRGCRGSRAGGPRGSACRSSSAP